MKNFLNANDIDAILPQTQCGLCGYKGCAPYAEALANQTAAIDLCPPGGITGLLKIAALTHQDPTPYISQMEKKAKSPMRAVIREEECIGCTKCIQACPVDAILGAAKEMHTVISDECTGCELCIMPCPVDCIDLKPVPPHELEQKNHFRSRYQARNNRLRKQEKNNQLPLNKKLSITETLARIQKSSHIK